jgi:polyhydroxybutyrate depolymerase
MIKRFILVFFIWTVQHCAAQSFSFTYEGNNRSYIVHLPPGYTASNAYPMVLNFHGYTSTGAQQQGYSLMNTVADTAGFIAVYPDGIANSWNVGFGFTPYFTGVDDIGFVNALIDTMMVHYHIDADAVYATGMSNGGYLSNRLACELPNRIAAIASVTGPMTDSTEAYCNPSRKVPAMHIHGTTDPIVNYNGAAQSLSVAELISFWGNHNGCPISSIDIPYPDVNTGDGSTATRKNYQPCTDGAEVVLIEIANGGHTWPGASVDIPMYGNTNRDFFASGEIWNFFRRFRLNQFIGIEPQNNQWINVHPNPAFHDLYISPGLEYTIFTMKGKVLLQGISTNEPLDISKLSLGMYYVQMKTEKQVIVRKILKI